jgi:hypothetical protein
MMPPIEEARYESILSYKELRESLEENLRECKTQPGSFGMDLVKNFLVFVDGWMDEGMDDTLLRGLITLSKKKFLLNESHLMHKVPHFTLKAMPNLPCNGMNVNDGYGKAKLR